MQDSVIAATDVATRAGYITSALIFLVIVGAIAWAVSTYDLDPPINEDAMGLPAPVLGALPEPERPRGVAILSRGEFVALRTTGSLIELPSMGALPEFLWDGDRVEVRGDDGEPLSEVEFLALERETRPAGQPITMTDAAAGARAAVDQFGEAVLTGLAPISRRRPRRTKKAPE